MKKLHLLIFILAIVSIILISNYKFSPKNRLEESIIDISKNQNSKIELPEGLTKLIKSHVIYSEENGYIEPEIMIRKQSFDNDENDEYSVLLLFYKYDRDGTQVGYKHLHFFVEIEKELLDLNILDFKVLNTFI